MKGSIALLVAGLLLAQALPTEELLLPEEEAAVREFLEEITAYPLTTLDKIFKQIYTKHPEIKALHTFADVPVEELLDNEDYVKMVKAVGGLGNKWLDYLEDPRGSTKFFSSAINLPEFAVLVTDVTSPAGMIYFVEDFFDNAISRGIPALTSGFFKLFPYSFEPFIESLHM